MWSASKIKKKKILVIGDVMIDRYHIGQINRMSSEAPVPIFSKKSEHCCLGGAANVAFNLAFADQNVSIAAVVGMDSYSDMLVEMCRKHSINTETIVRFPICKMTVKNRLIIDNKQQIARIDCDNILNITQEIENEFIAKLSKAIPEHSVIVVSDYNKGGITKNIFSAIVSVANSHRIKVLVDVKGNDCTKYRGAYLVKPNFEELHTMLGISPHNDSSVVELSRELRKKCCCKYVLTTEGSRGMTLVDHNNRHFHEVALAKEAHNVVGAGDTVIAFVAVGIANQFTVQDSVSLANFAVAIKVSKQNMSYPTKEELSSMQRQGDYTSKVMTVDNIVSDLKMYAGKTIVFTNGCFDIFHYGHLHCLKEASKLGDILIVGVNSDESIKRIKGKKRPIINETERMLLVAGLPFVDYVVKFDEDTPLRLIEKIKPDILAKGGDYDGKEIVGKDVVEQKNGKIVILPYFNGYSTSSIITKIIQTEMK